MKPSKNNQQDGNDARLAHRPCPSCDADRATPILTLSLSEFARKNVTYRQDIVDTFGFSDTDVFPIVRCDLCGFQYVQKRLNDGLLSRLYSEVIDHDMSRKKIYRAQKRRMLTRYWMDILSLLDRQGQSLETLRVLDFGCGWGDFLGAAEGPGVQLFGYEPDSIKADSARESGIHIFSNLDELQDSGPFNVVLSNAVWEHLDDIKTAARLFHDVLKPEGVGIVTVPNGEPRLISKMSRRQRKGEPIGGDFNPWEHINYFTRESLERTALDAGLIPILPQEDMIIPFARKAYDLFKLLGLNTALDRFVPVGPAVYPTRLYLKRR